MPIIIFPPVRIGGFITGAPAPVLFRAEWFNGEGVPTTVVGAVPGDCYLDSLTGDVYNLGEGLVGWELISNIRGAEGPQGPPGASGGGYTYSQTTPASVWTVNHNLSKYPNIELIDDNGEPMWTDYDHISMNTVTITFPSPTTGKALFS